MNPKNFDEWKSTVQKLNSDAESIISLRDKVYSQLADELKTFFAEHNLPIKNMHFNNRGDNITVHIDKDTSSSVLFSKTFLRGIPMPFSVHRTLNCDDGKVEHELFFELYPLEEEY